MAGSDDLHFARLVHRHATPHLVAPQVAPSAGVGIWCCELQTDAEVVEPFRPGVEPPGIGDGRRRCVQSATRNDASHRPVSALYNATGMSGFQERGTAEPRLLTRDDQQQYLINSQRL